MGTRIFHEMDVRQQIEKELARNNGKLPKRFTLTEIREFDGKDDLEAFVKSIPGVNPECKVSRETISPLNGDTYLVLSP